MTTRPALAALSLICLSLTSAAFAQDAPTPTEIVAAALAQDWTAIPAADLLVMDLASDSAGAPRRVVIQLISAPFAQPWVGNVRKLAAAQWWDGLSINRVQDNYVVQWGDADGEDAAKARPLPTGLASAPQSAYVTPVPPRDKRRLPLRDAYAAEVGYTLSGWPYASDGAVSWPVHCYGMVGVGRNLAPETGTGAELYVVIGHAPRHLDRNIALVGRVIEGIELLSSLPRGTGDLGFYERATERVRIGAARSGAAVADLPTYEFLSPGSETFGRYAAARMNRKDAFFVTPAGGADICNTPLPVRRQRVDSGATK